MPGSIPEFDITSTLIPARVERGSGRRIGSPRILRTDAGRIGVVLTFVLFATALLAGWIAPAHPFASVAPPLRPPTLGHPMGTDDPGRDVFSGVVYGARTSLFLALIVSMLSGSIGVAVGSIAAWQGRGTDDAFMRIMEFVQVVPRFFLAVVVVALFGPGLDRLILLLGLTSWPLIARVVRAEVLSLRERQFVEAARALGTRGARILGREILPGVLPAAIVVASVNAGSVILLEAGLSFLGLGDPAAMSWGYLANNAQRFLRVAWWMPLFPGGAIALAVLGFNLTG